MKTPILSKSVLTVAIATGIAMTAGAIPSVSLHTSNVGIDYIDVSISGNTITIEEWWNGTGPGVLEISGISSGNNYVVQKILHNNSGTDWTRLANELLDPSGDQNDTDRDVAQLGFVPVGFSTSNDYDGLSFAQSSGIPRTSSVFSDVFADELSDARDFLDFFNGTLANGGTDNFMTFGLRDNADNQPFLLMQRPNAFSRPSNDRVPDAGSSLVLLGISLCGAFGLRQKMKR